MALIMSEFMVEFMLITIYILSIGSSLQISFQSHKTFHKHIQNVHFGSYNHGFDHDRIHAHNHLHFEHREQLLQISFQSHKTFHKHIQNVHFGSYNHDFDHE